MAEQYPTPPQGNFELQQQYLGGLQAEISQRLFISGAASRIMGDETPKRGAKTDLTGLAQLDVTFVPAYHVVQTDEHTERALQLVAIAEGTTPQDGTSRSFTYREVGRVDNTGTLFHDPAVDATDAEAVHQAAQELDQARDDGTLPNLRADLLAINNPRTSIANKSGAARK